MIDFKKWNVKVYHFIYFNYSHEVEAQSEDKRYDTA